MSANRFITLVHLGKWTLEMDAWPLLLFPIALPLVLWFCYSSRVMHDRKFHMHIDAGKTSRPRKTTFQN